MANVPVSSLSTMQKAQLCCTYAALILSDEGLEVSGPQMKKLIEASGNKIENFWPGIFSKALQGQNIKELLMGGGAVAGAGAGSSGAQAGAGAAAKEEEKPAEKPAEEEEEEEVGMDLFGF